MTGNFKVLNAVAALCSSLQLAVQLEAQCCGCAEMLSDAETGAALEAMRLNAQRPEPRYLLLGATGNVGKHCLERLLADAAESGDAVRLIVGTRDPERFWSGYRHPRRCPGLLHLSLSARLSPFLSPPPAPAQWWWSRSPATWATLLRSLAQ